MTELLPEEELVTRALASSRDRVGSAVQGQEGSQLHASYAMQPHGSGQVGKVMFCASVSPFFKAGNMGTRQWSRGKRKSMRSAQPPARVLALCLQ